MNIKLNYVGLIFIASLCSATVYGSPNCNISNYCSESQVKSNTPTSHTLCCLPSMGVCSCAYENTYSNGPTCLVPASGYTECDS